MNGPPLDNKSNNSGLAFQPLYKQVEEHVTQLIVKQRWKPGEMLPNEFQLAEEFGVSQGTVRKALNSLTDANVVTRRQGVGTFVSEHTVQQGLNRFFPLVADGQLPTLPIAQQLSVTLIKADNHLRERLQLNQNERVIQLKRLRLLNKVNCIHENIFLPEKYFPGLEREEMVPQPLYHYYQTQYGLTVHKTQDSIKASLSSDEDAELLGIHTGEPILQVSRITHSLDGRVMEYRCSRCRSDHYHYLVEIG